MKLLESDTEGDYVHYCPGCDQLHLINTKRKNDNDAQWSFDNNFEKPTFSPSINIVKQCHYFIRNGFIEYCSDSKHKLKGETIELPNIPEDFL